MSKQNPPPTKYRLPVANEALLQAPIYEEHQRGANWLAVIDVDASMPGGLARRFLQRGKGACLYIVEQLTIFDPVEFGADYTTSAGTKKRSRWYGIIVAKTDGEIEVEECIDGARAVLRSKAARANPDDQRHALKAKLAALDEQRQALEREIGEIT